MSDPDYTLAWPDRTGSRLPEPPWVGDDFVGPEEYPPADVTGGLASLRFITAAIRRRTRLWCTTAAIGLLAACAYYVLSPPAYQASALLLLTPGPYENVNTVQNDDQAMAQTRTVAELALHKLGLNENASSLLGSYSAVPITERVMRITASAPSSQQAVQRANAVAEAFLQFRADDLRAAQQLVLASLNQQVSQAQQQLDSIDSRISQLNAQSSSAQQSQLKSLRRQRASAQATLYNLQQAATGNQTTIKPQTSAAVKGSIVLDAATPLTHSRLKPLIVGAAMGLVVGLVLGMAIVVIQALVSDKLRRRDDVAHALGATVRLSVPAVRPHWWQPWRGRRPAANDADVERIAGYLGQVVPGKSRGVAALAVVPVDDLQVPALAVVSLAVSLAQADRRVVVADVCAGAPAAKLLGAADPGVGAVSVHDTRLVVAVPEPDDMAPSGPLGHRSARDRRSPFSATVADACASADILLTLATLDPALGGEHLATWATDAVVMVTAGRSSSTRVHGVGEMIRLSGTRLVSAVLVGADTADDSLGAGYLPEFV
ncbi:MAG: Wzz/FepE/Etk N-terminal domain-containing protein [Micromonosporaceae bacterium]